jgi:hypothetical protein
MTLVLNGTTGVSSVDGSASTPAIQGNDTNTGVFFPAADTVAIATGGTERARVDSSGNVGVGTSSPSGISTYPTLDVRGASGGGFRYGSSTANGYLYSDSNGAQIGSGTNHPLVLYTNGTERARIDSSGNFIVNGSGTFYTNTASFTNTSGTGKWQSNRIELSATSTGATDMMYFRNSNGIVGAVGTNGSSTYYNTSSDYRLKEDVQPMAGALAKVAALKPVTYKWKSDGSAGEGFIAHELQAVVPGCVIGEKDAVDADGKPRYQGIDTSFLSATLAAAIQELHQIVQAQAAEIAELKANLP